MPLKYIHIKDESVQTMLGNRLGFDPDRTKEEFPIGWYYAQRFGKDAGVFYSVHETLEGLIEAYEDQIGGQKPFAFKKLKNGFYGIGDVKLSKNDPLAKYLAIWPFLK